MVDVNTAKSYATRENLIKDLTKKGLVNHRPIIVRNDAGRWTAIFGYALSGIDQPFVIPHLGYIIVN
jgi:hypothetical protein